MTGVLGRIVAPIARCAMLALIGLAVAIPRADAAQQPEHAHHATPTSAASTPLPPDEEAFLRAARAGTQRYRDIAAARADGYRRVGGELPSLGEHWVHNGRALADRLDPGAPPILVYAMTGATPTLAGVAYTRFLRPGDPYPAFPSSVAHAWHDHNGGVDDEVLPLGHLTAKTVGPPASGPRLRIAVMHAWIGIDNPAGVWTSENWGLAYTRVGLDPGAGPAGADARALSLAGGAGEYYLRAIATVGALDDREREHARTTLATYTARIRAQLDGIRATSGAPERLNAREIERLAADWEAMWGEIARGIAPAAAQRLAPLIQALGPTGNTPTGRPFDPPSHPR